MSYIWSGSNPEGLYIWGDGENVHIHKEKETIGSIPRNIFNGLIKKYVNNYYEDVDYDGAKLINCLVDLNDNEIQEFNPTGGSNFKCVLSYNGWRLAMWEVTWNYIVHNNYIQRKTK